MSIDLNKHIGNLIGCVVRYKYTQVCYKIMSVSKNHTFKLYEIKEYDGEPNTHRLMKVKIEDLFKYFLPIVDKTMF